jgi:hypothetical protein
VVLEEGTDLEAPGSTMKHFESPDPVLVRVGAVESRWLCVRQDVQADSAVGVLEEIEARLIRRITPVVVGEEYSSK